MIIKNKQSVYGRYMNKHDHIQPECPVCGKAIYTSDLDDVEYVRTKRGTEIFIHAKCVEKWGESS